MPWCFPSINPAAFLKLFILSVESLVCVMQVCKVFKECDFNRGDQKPSSMLTWLKGMG
jgi:hypothetical protein